MLRWFLEHRALKNQVRALQVQLSNKNRTINAQSVIIHKLRRKGK